MGAYKKLNRQDVFVSDYVARKSWIASGSLLTEYKIDFLRGISSSLSSYPNDFYKGRSQELIWRSVDQLYYRGSRNDNTYTGSYEHYQQSTLTKEGSRQIGDEVGVVSIPRNVVGTNIGKESFVIKPLQSTDNNYLSEGYLADFNTGKEDYTENYQTLFGSNILDSTGYLVEEGDYVDESSQQYLDINKSQQRAELIDDGEGSLIFSGSKLSFTKDESVTGDIIYTHGQTVITNKDVARYYTTYLKPQVEWKANQPIYTYNVHCKVKDSEMNFTYNRTAVSGSNGQIASNVAGTDFSPYVTTIGLYNDANELLGVGKIGKPIPMSKNSDMTFELKIDI
tara:strand:+ start:569 stop:1582 length:1014 start_codon:yes stop_codon:yes gene_type:complete